MNTDSLMYFASIVDVHNVLRMLPLMILILTRKEIRVMKNERKVLMKK